MAAAEPRAEPPAQNKPDNTAFTQQRLPAWQPLLSAGTALPLFFCVGLACLALGLGLHFSSATTRELELDYTGAPGSGHNCSRCANASRAGAGAGAGSCTCLLLFELPERFPGPVCLYYQLSNYYQNHRRYGVSRDDRQLSGDAWGLKNPATECSPFRTDPQGIPIAPCGAIANSFFNDTFTLYHLINGSFYPVPLDKRGISWWTDSNVKFSNPEPVNGTLENAFKNTTKPPNWPRAAYQLDPDNPNNTGFINEDFIVWMRTAALPTFRKLYRRVHEGNFSSGLPQGTYCLNITYNYPVLSFQGTKKVIFSTVSWMGGKNPFLGIVYLVFGSACIITGFVMLAVHIKYQKQNQMDVE